MERVIQAILDSIEEQEKTVIRIRGHGNLLWENDLSQTIVSSFTKRQHILIGNRCLYYK